MARKKATEPFDISSLQRAPRYVWREVEREDADPLRVKVKDLSIAETNSIPALLRTQLSESLQVIAPFIVEWNFTAINTLTGKEVAVPPPAEVGWEVLELLEESEAGAILSWLKYPHVMKTEVEKKDFTASDSTPAP